MTHNFEGSNKGLELSIVGNCSYSALVNQRGSIVWACFPRFDGDPVFCSLLRKNQDIGFFDIEVCGLFFVLSLFFRGPISDLD